MTAELVQMPQMKKLRIALVDDQSEARERLAQVLSFFEEIDIVWTASSAAQALEIMQTKGVKVDVFLLDIEMPVSNGIELCKKLRDQGEEGAILMLSVSDSETYLNEALKVGANGYLLKGENPRVILRMAQDAAEGRLAFSPEMAQKTLHMLRQESPKMGLQISEFALTRREKQVLSFLVQSKTYQDIAEELVISPLTVRSHIENLYRKLGVHSKAELVAMAYQNNWTF